LIESEVISGAKPSRMLGRFRIGAPTVRAWTVTIREEVLIKLKLYTFSLKIACGVLGGGRCAISCGVRGRYQQGWP